CWNAGLDIQAWKSSSLRQRVYTRNVSRSSLGRSSSKASNPSMPLTSPARAANRATRSSARSGGTVIALIFTTLMISPHGPAGRAGRATLDERGPGAADTTPRSCRVLGCLTAEAGPRYAVALTPAEAAGRSALVAQEPLDLEGEIVAGRQVLARRELLGAGCLLELVDERGHVGPVGEARLH